MTDDSGVVSLLCDEVMDANERTPVRKDRLLRPADMDDPSGYAASLPPTVKAAEDKTLETDDRVLQNLLRNEARTIPEDDFLGTTQNGALTPGMRRVVAEWMLEVVHEQRSQPEVFSLAVNLMDRFLCSCRVAKQQLQLAGSVCILIASKMRETCPIPGQTLIAYTDYSITQEELKVGGISLSFGARVPTAVSRRGVDVVDVVGVVVSFEVKIVELAPKISLFDEAVSSSLFSLPSSSRPFLRLPSGLGAVDPAQAAVGNLRGDAARLPRPRAAAAAPGARPGRHSRK